MREWKGDALCEYPFEPSSLARDFTTTKLALDADGKVHLPEAPGLGIEPDLASLRPYLLDVEIKVGGRAVFVSSQSHWDAITA